MSGSERRRPLCTSLPNDEMLVKSGFISHEHLLRLKEAVYIKNVITDGQVGLGQGSVGRVRLDEIGSGQESGVRGR